MSRTHQHILTDRASTDDPSEAPAKQHTIGEGTAREKSGGETPSGEIDNSTGTTSGTAEGKEADIDQALQQQGKPKPR